MNKPRVVILGGGFAGLETAFLLRMRLKDRVDLALVSDRDTFLFKPNTIYLPFGGDEASLLIDLHKPLHRRHIAFHQGRVADVDTDRQRVHLEDGTVLPYDYLVAATGASMRPDEIPGMDEFAETIWTPREMLHLGESLATIREEALAGQDQRIVFLVPPNNKCSGPLYEMVFMLETWARRQGIRDRLDIAYSTHEESFIAAFGPRLHDVVTAEFDERGIAGHTGEVVERIEDGKVDYAGRPARAFDLLVTFPPYVAAARYDDLPSDDRGFIATVPDTRQVVGHPNIYAPGDGGDFPVKQAFLAFLQADAVAEHIASELSGGVFDAPFDPVSMCVMEMFDKATFAQVPLEETGDPLHPVRVRSGADADAYKVGVSPVWRIGKKMLGIYLPMRFRAGEPFHAGAGWQTMDVGLKGMVGLLAD